MLIPVTALTGWQKALITWSRQPATPYSMHEAIEKIVDTGTFLELQSR
jgi:acetyl-CoA carboxylase carboxyltransferase component